MKTAKKLLSVVLMLTLLVSAFSLVFTTASAADYTFMRNIEINKQILGAYNYDNQFISLVEDPTLPGTGIHAMRMYKTGKDQYSYIGLATDESATATEFEWEPNTKYALSFDYLLGADATIASFTIYKGAAPTYSASVAGKKKITSYSNGVSLNYKGDGKFHNAVVTFTTPEADADRPHIYLRLNGDGNTSTVVNTYIKNIKLVKYNNLPTAQSEGWEKYFTFDQDGNATPVGTSVKDTNGHSVINTDANGWTSSRYGNTNRTDSYFEYNEDGTLYADTHTDLSYTVGSAIGGMSFTIPKEGEVITPYHVKEGVTYNISVKFKFTKSPNSNKAPYNKSKIGFAYLVSNTSNYVYKTVSNAYCVEPINVVTFGDTGYTEADTWYTVSLNNWTAQHTAVLRLFIGGQAGFIIDKVNVSVVDDALTLLTVNDNGTASTRTAVKGAKLDGYNAAGVEGKKFEGWFTTATFDEGTETTVVPNANNANIYAKYVDDIPEITDSEVVAEGSIRDEKSAEDNNGVYQSAGIRFKGRVSSAFRESATEIGFYAVPTAALDGKTIEEFVATENALTVSAKVKADGMEEVVYEVFTDAYGRKFYDYQLIITGLTKEGETKNLLGLDITCVMYAVVDGNTVYTNTQNYSYNDMANK